MAKYNWSKLKTKYITGGYKSLKDFADKEGIPYNQLRKNSAGWVKEKGTKEEQKGYKITEKIIEKQIESEAQLNLKHYALWEMFVKKLASKAKNPLLEAKDIKALADVLEKAQKGQRLAAGLKDENDTKDNGSGLEEALTKAWGEEIKGENSNDKT